MTRRIIENRCFPIRLRLYANALRPVNVVPLFSTSTRMSFANRAAADYIQNCRAAS